MSTSRSNSTVVGARLNGPPNFGDPVLPQSSPPPSYVQVRSVSRREIGGFVVQHGASQDHSLPTSDSEQGRSTPPIVTGTVTNLEDIRHTEQYVHLNNRISSVPNYPVLLEGAQTPRRERSQRRSSVASTNTAGLLISVGSMPGSEPFDESSLRTSYAAGFSAAYNSHEPVSPLLSPLSPFEAATAQIMTVQRVNRSSTISSPPSHQPSWSVDTASNFADRWNPPSQGYYSPELEDQPFVRPSQTWPSPSLEQRIARLQADPRMHFSKPREGARDINCPPTPPPKDPGYVARRPTKKSKSRGLGSLRKAHSTPNLLLFPRTEQNSHGRTRSHGQPRQEWGNAVATKAPAPKRYSSLRKSSQILNLCAKFIHRSVPRISVSA
ncbi:uncharacterized protein PV09_07268 [Verruconis gallopava]|uniref:Uncharacterized protein n=1 Tax=Verruconis gallopava TaxID=253628 RepID=A0A0D2APY1_9PEZI|nr:uncharacterized protein PV09_07268 [Verruconis gallopava]KIW01224.1 hypothetical protein PV09_07268 [Verruconis gallopava]